MCDFFQSGLLLLSFFMNFRMDCYFSKGLFVWLLLFLFGFLHRLYLINFFNYGLFAAFFLTFWCIFIFFSDVFNFKRCAFWCSSSKCVKYFSNLLGASRVIKANIFLLCLLFHFYSSFYMV
uniref:Putative membrane protein n=1 Tax=Rhipicephalus microplus TaxID=6941 RepID=A0A6M2CXN1_RHIMP